MFFSFIGHHPDAIGLVGVVMILVTYFLLQVESLSQTSVSYSLFNFLGSICILVSLYYSWNLSSGVIEVFWLLISLFGLIKSLRKRYGKSPA